MFLSGEKVEGEKCISAQGSSVKGSSQQSSTPGPKVKGEGPLFSGQGPFIMGGLVNDTTPDFVIQQSYKFLNTISLNSYALKQTFELPFITARNEVGARLCSHRHV